MLKQNKTQQNRKHLLGPDNTELAHSQMFQVKPPAPAYARSDQCIGVCAYIFLSYESK